MTLKGSKISVATGVLPPKFPERYVGNLVPSTKKKPLGAGFKPVACFTVADEETSILVSRMRGGGFRIHAYDDKKKLFEFCVWDAVLLEQIIEAIKAEQVQDEFNNQASSNLQMNVGSESP